MHAYRAATGPSSDEEVAALAELSDRVRSLKLRLVLPMVLFVLASGAAAALLHVGGHWSVAGRMADGSYMVGFPTVAIALLLAGGGTALPCYALYLHAVGRLFERWKRHARERYGLRDPTLSDFAAMFDPKRSAVSSDETRER